MEATGRITQVMGPVVDVEFPANAVPNILNSLKATNSRIDDTADNLVLEVAQHLGGNTVRCVAMDTTDGLRRGQSVKDTGQPITVPVGREVLGRYTLPHEYFVPKGDRDYVTAWNASRAGETPFGMAREGLAASLRSACAEASAAGSNPRVRASATRRATRQR